MAPVAMRAGVSSMVAKPVAAKVAVRASARAMPALGNFAKASAPLIAKPQVRHARSAHVAVEFAGIATMLNHDALANTFR